MKRFNYISLIIISSIAFGCNQENPDKVKEFNLKNVNSISVDDRIVDINLNFMLRFGKFNIMDNLLIFNDLTPTNDKGIHLFNRETFDYITSTGKLGRGPGEISGLGQSVINPCETFLWVDDLGQFIRWKFPIDSILNNNHFLPTVKINMDSEMFLVDYELINDSNALGLAVIPLSSNSAEMIIAKHNLKTGKTEKFGYEYSGINARQQTYSTFKLDKKNMRYIRCYERLDLMSICDLNGELMFNVNGPLINFKKNDSKHYHYFKKADTYFEFILASYLGGEHMILKEGQPIRNVYPSKLLVFNNVGDLIKTIEVGYEFSAFCVDEVYNRVILYFEDRENSLGYFSLEGILN